MNGYHSKYEFVNGATRRIAFQNASTDRGIAAVWTYRNPVDVRFGAGSFAGLAGLIGARSYALVTYADPYFRGLADELAGRAGRAAIVVDDIAPNPDVAALTAQCARFAGLARAPKVIVALGGGSVIDSAKVFAAAKGDFAVVGAYLKGAAGASLPEPTPLIAVPTTGGTGSEVTCWGTVWDNAAGAKYSLAHPRLYPQIALVDPALMLAKPRELTIQTGLDALSHALESLWNRNANPVSMAHAITAARGALATLPRLANDLQNLALREAMARAALLAGFAFSNTKTAIAHSISYPITLRHNVPHGVACSFTLPMVMRSMEGVGGLCGEGLAAIFGTDSMAAAADALQRQLEALGIATAPASYGIAEDEWRALILAAFDGERGQNFIGERGRMLAAAGLD